jgi:spoIIIJ-associated protein
MRTQITAKTVSEAIDKALERFDTTIDNIGYDVVQEPSKGFLGIGSKQAIVNVWTLDENDEKKSEEHETAEEVEETEPVSVEEEESTETEIETQIETDAEKTAVHKVITDPTDGAKAFLQEVFEKMGISVEIEAQFHDRHLDINLKGAQMGVIIGKRGQTLDSLQYLLSLVVNKGETAYVSVSLDTEDYRKRRKETLEKLAFNLAKKSKHLRKDISLEPMSSYERRIIHSTLQNDRYVTTHSEGDEPYRYVVIAPKQYYR